MSMVFSTLTAISPVDGRYRNKAENLAAYFSEYALIKYRVQVEIEYFITLAEYLPQLNNLATVENKEALRKIYKEFSLEDATRIKEIESVTNHDVKAVEYFIKEKFRDNTFCRFDRTFSYGYSVVMASGRNVKEVCQNVFESDESYGSVSELYFYPKFRLSWSFDERALSGIV